MGQTTPREHAMLSSKLHSASTELCHLNVTIKEENRSTSSFGKYVALYGLLQLQILTHSICRAFHSPRQMSNKISHARIEELEDKLGRRTKKEAQIQTMQAKMQELKDKIPTKLKLGCCHHRLQQGQDEIDALDIDMKRLEKAKAEIQDEIDLLKGWG